MAGHESNSESPPSALCGVEVSRSVRERCASFGEQCQPVSDVGWAARRDILPLQHRGRPSRGSRAPRGRDP
ncbi:hypothetical protein G6F57_017447 [Rhizopus arrhizus]|nr:hypothetical protein G6F65_023435 [Rhizopus arrhizus]KAG1445941.1 hypothetical protein G6F57_017447 [Rhizopus arrhizus]